MVDDRFRVEAASGTPLATDVSAVAAHARRTRQPRAKQHAADRLVAVAPDGDAVTFFGWWRPPGAAAISSGALDDGRLSAALQLTASDLDGPSDSATRTLVYDLLGPG